MPSRRAAVANRSGTLIALDPLVFVALPRAMALP
jgi:hypothetical protein